MKATLSYKTVYSKLCEVIKRDDRDGSCTYCCDDVHVRTSRIPG